VRYPLDGPVRVNSPFGPRTGGFHYGVDLFAMEGTPCYAVDSGEVFYAFYETAGGNHLAMYLDHPPPGAPKAGYMHLQRFAVLPGTRVNEGDIVGWTDTTGAGLSGPHLHFWMGENANVGAIDPLPYITPTGEPGPPPPSGHVNTGFVVDFQYLRPTPNTLIAAGYTDVICYLGNPRLSGDACPSADYLDVLSAAGIRLTFIYETDPNRSQQGHDVGVEDGRFSDQRARERGYPPDGPFFVCASDGNASDPSSGGDQIAEYARGFAEATGGRKLGAYGNRYAVDSFNRGVPRERLMVTDCGRDGGWVPLTWGADPGRDLIGQDQNVKMIGDTDHNYIYADWWPGNAAPGPPVYWPDVLLYLEAMKGDDPVAAVIFRDHEASFRVDADHNLRHDSFDVVGQHVANNEVLIEGGCESISYARVAPGIFGGPDALVCGVEHQDGHLMRIWWSDDGWHDTDNNLVTEMPMKG